MSLLRKRRGQVQVLCMVGQRRGSGTWSDTSSRRREARARGITRTKMAFKAPSCLEHHTQSKTISLPAWSGGGISSARTMLQVFSREGGDSFRNLDRRERRPLKKAATYSTQNPPKLHRDRISFHIHQDGLNTTHTAIQALSAGCGGNVSIRNTMLLAFNSEWRAR